MAFKDWNTVKAPVDSVTWDLAVEAVRRYLEHVKQDAEETRRLTAGLLFSGPDLSGMAEQRVTLVQALLDDLRSGKAEILRTHTYRES